MEVRVCHKDVKRVRDREDKVKVPARAEAAGVAQVPVGTASARAAVQRLRISPAPPA